jgi:glycosyltransferase involved in cell wall biosynthesis
MTIVSNNRGRIALKHRCVLMVAGDFVKTGGMDRANHALASFLADRGFETHLVAHSVEPALRSKPNVSVHLVPKLLGSYAASGPLLDLVGRRCAARIAGRDGRVVVNGGNCRFGDINWVHYVHAAFELTVPGSMLRRARTRASRELSVSKERQVLSKARVIFTNSNRTKRDVVEKVGISSGMIHSVYYGNDPLEFRPATEGERAGLRSELGLSPDRCLVAFVGALGDRRKGFDTLFAAWRLLCLDKAWDADLIVVGRGAELPLWKERAAEGGLESRVRFLGFRSDVPAILRACDAMVAPARYEAYGLAVQEALCSGVPAFVSALAGVAERYPKSLGDLLLTDPEDEHGIAARLRSWRTHRAYFNKEVDLLSRELGAHTWDRMAERIMELAEASS